MEISFKLKHNGKWQGDELREHVEYEVVFLRELTKQEEIDLQRNYEGVLSKVYKTYVLKFRNYVGKVTFLGQTLNVVSRKWSPAQVQRMWLEVSEQAAALLYSHFSVVKQVAQRSHKERDVLKFQQWVFLRDQLLYRDELRSAWELIAREPHTLVRQDRVRSESWNACEVEVSSWIRAFETENVTMLREGHPLAKSVAAQFGRPALPSHVDEIRKRVTFDTKENRFLKFMLGEMMQLVEWKERFVLRETKKKVFGIDLLLEENRDMKRKLQGMLSVPWFAEVGRFAGDYGNSTVLQRREGYRQWFAMYQEWLQGIRCPFDQEDLNLLVETRDIARIYEYWCFFKVLQAVEKVTGCARQEVSVRRNGEYGKHLGNETEVIYAIGDQRLSVFYNKTFSRANGGSSSVKVRPDISLKWGDEWFHFDAKFKDGYAKRDFTLREDVERMHLYKDAIHNSRVAIALYPARKRVFSRFYRSGQQDKPGGVGVIGLQLERSNKRLERMIDQIIKGGVLDADVFKQDE